MAGGGDEVEKGVDTIVAEAGVTLDTRLFRENIVVLAFKVANNLLEPIAMRGNTSMVAHV